MYCDMERSLWRRARPRGGTAGPGRVGPRAKGVQPVRNRRVAHYTGKESGVRVDLSSGRPDLQACSAEDKSTLTPDFPVFCPGIARIRPAPAPAACFHASAAL